MKIAPPQSADRVARQSQGQTAAPAAKSFVPEGVAPGTLLKGTVLRLESSGRYLVETQAGSFRAQSFVPLEIGRNFWFEVAEGGSKPLLVAANLKNSITDLLKVLLPGMGSFSGLPDLAEAEGPSASAARQLLQLVTESAVGSEPDPARLIKMLMLVRGAHGSGGSQKGQPAESGLAAGRDLLAGVQKESDPVMQKLAQLLESHQGLNRPLEPAGGAVHNDFYLFPCFFAGNSGFGEWLFSFDRQGGHGAADEENAPGQRLSFYLVMSELGDLHLDLSLREAAIQGTFSLASPEAASHFAAHLPLLEAALQQFCETVSLTCSHSQLSTLQKIKDDLSARAGMQDFVLLDVTA